MRNSRSYQLVSKHSIQRNAQGDMHKIMESNAEGDLEHRVDSLEHRVEDMQAKLEEIKRCLRLLNSEPAKSSHRSGSRIESNMMRRNQKPVAKEDRDDAGEKIEKNFSDLRSRKPEEKGETEELNTEKDGIEGSSGVPWNGITKPEGDDISSDREPPNDQVTTEAQREEEFPEDSSSETPYRGARFTEESSLIDLGEITTSCVTVLCDREVEEERSCIDDQTPATATMTGSETPETATVTGNGTTATKVPSVHDLESMFLVVKMCDSEREEKQSGSDGKAAGTAPEEENDAVTVEEKLLARDEGEKILSRSGKTKETSVEWSSMQLDPAVISLGQAQVTVSKSAQTLLFTPAQFIINEEVLQVKRQVNPVANSLGQPHNFIITPPIFTNSGGVLQLEGGLTNQREQLFHNSPLVSRIPCWPVIEEKGELSPNTVSSYIEVEALKREVTILYDLGGSLSTSCITWSSCFKLWDPGGRLLTVRFQYLHLEDKVNV